MFNDSLPVAILAGGLATRMRPLTETFPKALLEVAGEPFVAHQLRSLARQGVQEVVLCLGYRGEMVEEFVGDGAAFGVDVTCVYDGEVLLGTAGALRRALPHLGEAFFVLYGDSYLTCDFRAVQRTFEDSGLDALMTVYRNDGRFDSSNVLFEENRIVAYEKSGDTPGKRHIDYGLGVLSAKLLDAVPADQPHDLELVYQEALAEGRLVAHEVHERFFEIGSFDGLEETDTFIRTQRNREAA